MFRNYLLTALRSFKRNKAYATLNIFGLALGIGCAFVLISVIDYHHGFDKHLTNLEKIYRVVGADIHPDGETYDSGTQHPFAEALRIEYPEFEAVARVHYAYGDQINVYQEDGSIEKFAIEEGLVFIEPTYFEVFDVNWIAGDPSTALTEPNTVVLAQSMTNVFFDLASNEADQAIGKRINLGNLQDLMVVGVIEDPIKQTNFPFTVLVEYEVLAETDPYYGDGKSWNSTSSSTNTYFIADESFDAELFHESMYAFIDKFRGEGSSDTERYYAQPMSEVHFDERYSAYSNTISVELLWSLAIIAVFLVITASINFINLSTAQAGNRAKEIGIRKAIGGYIGQLRVQFLAEIGVITAIALVLSLAVSELMFIVLEDLVGHRLTLDLIAQPYKILVLVGLFVGVSLLSGLYPSFLLSKMNTVVALKSKVSNASHSGGFNLRKGLVVLQFAISQLLIIGTIVVKTQSDYFFSKDVGFDKDAIVSCYLPERDKQKMERFRTELMSSPSISDVSMSLSEPIGNSDSWTNMNYAPLESENAYTTNMKACDDRFVEFWGIDMLAGRTVQASDSGNNVVINKKIADLMGFEDRYSEAIGEMLNTGWGGDKKIVGVSDNFHVRKLTEELPYVTMIYEPNAWYNASFKIAAGADVSSTLDHFRATWELVFPEYVSDYEFYEESYAAQYQDEVNTAQLLLIFSVISIVIGCLGLYGLVSFMAINKTKEIGVRKVLGASMWSILYMYSKEIILLMMVAFAVAAPTAYYFLNGLLEEIPYSIDLNVVYFIVGLLSTLLVSFLTISHRTIASARLNPATTLKDE